MAPLNLWLSIEDCNKFYLQRFSKILVTQKVSLQHPPLSSMGSLLHLAAFLVDMEHNNEDTMAFKWISCYVQWMFVGNGAS